MSFTNPQGWWLLALGIPILAFHFYRGRFRRMAVPHLLFWEQVLVEEERRTALKKLRRYASLLLNLAALIILTSAVSGPRMGEPARFALIVDNSPGMAAANAHVEALERAEAFARARAHGDRMALYDLSGARAPMTSDPVSFVRRLVPFPPSRGNAAERVREALATGDDVQAILFTDHVPAGLEDLLDPINGRLHVVRVGRPMENAGWIGGMPVRNPEGKGVTLVLEVANFSDREAARTVVLRFEGRELARREARLAPGAREEREWKLDPSDFPGARIEEGGLAEVSLEPADAFPMDDVASFVVPPRSPPSIIVFHPGKPDEGLMHAFHTLRRFGIAGEIGEAPASRYASVRDQIGEGWIVVFDRVAPPAALGRGGFLIVGAPGDEPVDNPSVADWDRVAPPNRLVDYSGLKVLRSRILRGRPLIRAVEGPIATWDERGGRAVVELGFALQDSNLPFRRAHILLTLLVNVVEWASYRGVRSFPTAFRVGEPLRPTRPLWIDEGSLEIERPGRIDRVAVKAGRLLSPPAAEPGFVRISGSGRSEEAAVNLFDPEESDLRAPAESPLGPPLPPPAPWHARIPYAVLAVAAVLALLLLEGWLYHRGTI